jgi:hypothetical protein
MSRACTPSPPDMPGSPEPLAAIAELPIFLYGLALTTVLTGDFGGAASLIAEAESVAAATGSRSDPSVAVLLAGLRGREAEAAAIEQASAGGQGAAASFADWAAAILYNGLARYPRGSGGRPARCLGHGLAVAVHLGAPQADRGGRTRRRRRSRTRGARAVHEDDAAVRYRRRARAQGSLPGTVELGCRRRAAISRGDRSGEPHSTPAGARTRTPALWRVAAS